MKKIMLNYSYYTVTEAGDDSGVNISGRYYTLDQLDSLGVEYKLLTVIEGVKCPVCGNELAMPYSGVEDFCCFDCTHKWDCSEEEMPIEVLHLPTRAYNGLINSGIKTVEDLTSCTTDELLKIKGIGCKSLKKIESALEEKGLSLSLFSKIPGIEDRNESAFLINKLCDKDKAQLDRIEDYCKSILKILNE
jgi:hypothetical protein